MLHGAAIELSKLKGRQTCLPEDYKDFGPLAKLLSTEDITKAEIKRYCKDNKLPNPLGDQARVQHEVYVWEQVRLIAVQEDKAGALKRLKAMANEADNTTIRDLAKRVLKDIAGFEPKAAMKKRTWLLTRAFRRQPDAADPARMLPVPPVPGASERASGAISRF